MEGGNEVVLMLRSPSDRFQPGLLEIAPVLHQRCAQRPHCPVLRRTVAVGDVDDGVNARAPGGKRYCLAIIAARGSYRARRNHSGIEKTAKIHEGTARFEIPEGCMVFVLEPHLGTDPFLQKG